VLLKGFLICNTFIIFKRWWGVILHHAYVKLVEFFVDLVLNLDPAPQKVLPPMQDEHGDVMEENEWVHESSRRCCKVNACINS